MSAHENLEHAEHAEHASHGGNKKIALLIAVLALFLAFSETLGKSAQTSAITYNVATNDLWAFFQAKTIRMTVLSTAAEQVQIEADRTTDAGRQSAACQGHRRLEEDRRALQRRAGNQRRPQAARRARERGRGKARTGARALSPIRIRLGGVPDRHRACLGGSDHQHGGAGLAVRAASALSVSASWRSDYGRRTRCIWADQDRTRPPSTLSVCPVMKAASSLVRNETAPTRSSGTSTRLIACICATALNSSSMVL